MSIPALVCLLLATGEGSLAQLAAGILAWTGLEYLIHRFLFHRLPLFRAGHDLHHAKPSGRTGVTSWHSLVIFAGLWLALPSIFLAGIALGYLGYVSAHHAVHHWRIGPGHPLYRLKLRHALHHRGVEANFGVVTTAWDRVFGTYVPVESRQP